MMFNNRFNVAIQSRCFSIVCLVLVVVAIVLAMIGYFLSPLNTKVAPYQFVFEVVMRISRLVAIPIPSIYFTVLLRSLHQRFVALNSSMRFVFWFKWCIVCIFILHMDIGNDFAVKIIVPLNQQLQWKELDVIIAH